MMWSGYNATLGPRFGSPARALDDSSDGTSSC